MRNQALKDQKIILGHKIQVNITANVEIDKL